MIRGMHVTKCDTPLERLKSLRDTSLLSFRQIADLPEFTGIPPGTLCAIYKGKSVPKRWRARFGMPDAALVVVVGEAEIPPGTQVATASRCACGQWFVSNHPRRARCFICSPYKGRRKTE